MNFKSAITELWTQLQAETDGSLIDVYLSVGVTAAVVFFSISIIPFQQYANQYTPALFTYLWKHKALVAQLVLLAFFTGLLLILPLFDPTRLNDLLGFVLAILILFLIARLWLLTTFLLDPSKYLIPAIASEVKRSITKCVNELKTRQKTDFERVAELKDMIEDSILSSSAIDPDRLYKIKREDINDAFRKLRNLKELAAALLQKGQIEIFDAAMGQVAQCVEHYLLERDDCQSTLDDFLIDLSDEFSDLLPLASAASSLHANRIIWKTIEAISISSLNCQTAGYSAARNSLANPFLDILERCCIRDLALSKSDSAFEAVRSLGRVGVARAQKGAIASASETGVRLSSVSLLAEKANKPEVAMLASSYVADILFNMAFYRRLFTNYNYPYSQLVKACNEILTKSTRMPGLGHSDPILWYDPDLITDRSLASTIRVAFFPASQEENDEYDRIISANLEVTSKIITILCDCLRRGGGHGNHCQSQLYQASLWALAFIHPQATSDLLIYVHVVQIPLEKNRQIARAQLTSIRRCYFDQVKRWWSASRTNIYDHDDNLHSLLSIFYMDICLAEQFCEDDLEIIADELNELIAELLDSYKMIEPDEGDLAVLAPFAKSLSARSAFKDAGTTLEYLIKLSERHIRQRTIRRRRAARGRGVPTYISSGMGRDDHWRQSHIRRPIMTFNNAVFEKFDSWAFESENGA